MKDNEITGWALVVAVVTTIAKWEIFQKAAEKFLTRLVDGRYSRLLGRRLGREETTKLLNYEKDELDTLTIVLQRRWHADRVTVVEYDCTDEKLPPLATCIAEKRVENIPSVLRQIQALRLEQPVWDQIQRVFCSPSHSLFVSDVSEFDVPALRSQLLRSGVYSAYYQALPTATGTCGAMLSLSWTTRQSFTEEELAGLHVLVRGLASTLRAVWAHQLPAAA
jgi:hypothetical protein